MFSKPSPWLRCAATALLIAAALGGWFGAALVYQYDHLLFLTASDYAADALSSPAGAAEYLAAAWAELCGVPWIGALTTGLLLALGAAGIGAAGADRWSLGTLAAWVVATGVFNPQFLGAASAWLLGIGIVLLWVRLGRARPEAAWAVVALAYATGGVEAMVLAAGMVTVRLVADRRAWWWIGAAWAAAALAPLAGAYAYGLSFEAAYEAGTSLSWWAVGCSIAAAWASGWKKEAKTWWTWAAFGAATVGGAIGLLSQSNPQLEATMRIEQAAQREAWDEVLERTARWEERYGTNRMVVFWRNTALRRQGKLLGRMFDVPQPYGPMGLFFEWDENQGAGALVGAKLGAESYLNAGLLWQAYRLTYEAMVGGGATHYTLRRLAAYNRALGREQSARQFEHILGHTLRGHKPTALPRPAAGCDSTAANPNNLVADLQQVVARDTTHYGALEYLTALYLSAGYTQGVVELAPRWTSRAQPIPETVQQALLAAGYPFRPDVRVAQRFERFVEQINRSRGNPGAVSADLHNTYWFYSLCLAQQRRQQ